MNWYQFSMDYDGIRIKDHALVNFFYSMLPPLGFKGMKSKSRKDVVIEILKMDLISDANGFVYFNELLYRSMRRVYGEEHVKNITLAQQELNVLKKLNEIRQRMIKKAIDKERASIKINPFLSLMYYKLSFKTWRSRTRKNKLIRQSGKSPRDVPEAHNDSIAQESVYSDITVKVESYYEDEEEKEPKTTTYKDKQNEAFPELQRMDSKEQLESQNSERALNEDHTTIPQAIKPVINVYEDEIDENNMDQSNSYNVDDEEEDED